METLPEESPKRDPCAYAPAGQPAQPMRHRAEQPQQLLQSVNRQFYENTAENATLFYSEFDDRTRSQGVSPA